nr:unnamed protein product [Digitaria exilis]
MAQSTTLGDHEHHVHMAPADTGDTPEKKLNGFVRAVALIERAGNALGTLAFTWATVVLLGGYPTVLRQQNDFWFATAIVFLEASRMFSRNNRLDYQLFFDTKGAFKPLGWTGLTVAVAFTSVFVFLDVDYNEWIWRLIDKMPGMPVLVLALAVIALGRLLSSGLARLFRYNPLRRAISLWTPFVPILFMGLSIYYEKHFGSMAMLVPFLLLLVVALVLTISRMQFPGIIKLVHHALGRKQVFWHPVLLNACTIATGVMVVFMMGNSDDYDEPDDYYLEKVLEIILVADGPELEIFIGLGSQISKIIPGDFTRELEDGHIKDRFVKRLIDTLNANMEPCCQCPGIRRVVLEQAITMMEHDSRYTICFIDRRMEDALSMVEETASEAENYGLFLGDVGLMEAAEPLSSLVAKAKQLLDNRRS